MKKRILSFALVLCMILTLFPASVFAVDTVVASGTCGENLTWTFDEGTLTISGTGDMMNYDDPYYVPWDGYREGISNVAITEGVTSIGDCAFMYCSSLTSINIPDSVTSIGDEAFYNCTSLSSVVIGDGVVSLGEDTFRDCKNLICVQLGNSIECIGKRAFYGCSNMECVYITDPAAWCNISFAEEDSNPCNYGADLYLDGIKLTDLVIPNGVTQIKDYAFYNCTSITDITIPDSVTSIGTEAFCTCRNLKRVTIPEGVTSIGSYAFQHCRDLASVTIPDSVVNIGYRAFHNCSGLTSIDVSENNPNYSSDSNGALFNKEKTELILYPASNPATSYTIPFGVTNLGDYAFYRCEGLKNVIIPDSVTTIGRSTFDNCTALKSIEIPKRITEIGNDAFNYCYHMDRIYFKGVMPTVGANAFKDVSAVAVYPKDDDSYMDAGTFGAKRLVWLMDGNPDGILSSGKCGDKIEWSLTNSGILSLSGNGKMPDYTSSSVPWKDINFCITNVIISDGIESICNYAFSGCSNLATVIIPDGVTSIGNYAFNCCTELTNIVIPDSVTKIGNDAFYKCSSLTSATIGNNVTSVGNYAFFYCSSLREVHISDLAAWCGISFGNNSANPLYYANELYLNGEKTTDLEIPNGVTSISNYAFYNCRNLTSVTIGNSVTSIGSGAFQSCSGLTSITIPDSVTSIGNFAFEYCSGLTSVTIGNSVTSIGSGAFQSCSGLTSVTIPDSVKSIGNYAFLYCSGLSSAIFEGNAPTFFDFIISASVFSCAEGFKILAPAGDTTWTNTDAYNAEAQTWNGYPIEFYDPTVCNHTYTSAVTAPTCTEQGYTTYTCTRCSDSYIDTFVDALGHDFGEWIVTTAPTCTEKGFETHNCSRCDATETREIKALGHDLVHHDGKAASCTEKGWETYDICSKCDHTTYKEIPATGHNYAAVVTDPSCTEQGYTTYTCDNCGDSYTADYVDAIGHNFVNGECTVCGATEPVAREGLIVVSDERARAGEEVTVSVSVEENPGIMVMVLGFDYDKSKLEFIGYEDGLMSGWKVASKAVWIGAEDVTANGVILKLKFKVLEDVEDGEVKVSVLFAEGDIANHDEQIIMPEELDGSITVYTNIPGDINGDDIVNALDLVRLQRYLTGEAVAVAASCDVNGDGLINAQDLVRLQRYLAGEAVTLC